ncbi:MAG: hypothetical protein R2705_03940 [Ilumatobacteraceae bacterium]
MVEGEWRALKDLRPGDLVGVASRTSTHGGSKVSSAEMDLAALLISEGHTPDVFSGPRRSIHFANTDPELLDAFRDAYRAKFARDHHRTCSSGGVTQLRLTAEELAALVPSLGVLGLSADKTVPDRLINAPAHLVQRFVALYFCGDGWADRSGAHFGSRVARCCSG